VGAIVKRSLYLRPLGLLPSASREAETSFGSLPLAGGWLDFMALEVTRRRGKEEERSSLGIGEFCEREWGGETMAAADLFERLRQPRPHLAGVSFERPRIMGVVNLTPDSFSNGGQFATAQAAIDHAFRLEEEGADILDLGAESTRPGSDAVSLDEELRRLIPVIEGLAGKVRAHLSVDTRKAEVMRRVAAAGVDLINDVAALTHEPFALAAIADTGLPVVLMHAQGDPKTMQLDPRYDNVLLDVFDFLEERIKVCEAAGIARSRVIADPGIGFGKTLQHNLELMGGLALFHGLGVPILLGASRKRFIGTLTGVERASDRVMGSVAAALQAVSQGAQIVRVHDVAATRQALSVWLSASGGRLPPSAAGSEAA
jgi:dihydropteroate synthase